MSSKSYYLFIVVVIVFLSIFFSLSKGSTYIPVYQLLFSNNDQFNAIFMGLRLPRTLTAFVAGGLLALAGSLMQLLLQNPLADPYVLGISGGAALFTLSGIMLGLSEASLIGCAWIGSLSTISIIFFLAKKHRWQSHTLLLSGIALACGFSAGISFILLIAPDHHLHSMLFWLTGDLTSTHLPWLGLAVLGIGFVVCMLLAPGLNILSRGEKEAQSLGLSTQRYAMLLYLLSSLFTATAVTLAGCIGFIGLIVPHITRLLIGSDHRLLLPISVMLGGSLLTVADTFARISFAPQQIPVGILMALLGVPVFIGLLQK